MFSYLKVRGCVVLCVALSSAVFSGCAKCDRSDEKGVIAYVNKEPILESELARDIALKIRQDPALKITPETEAEQLDAIIDRRLVVQKAMEKGLSREERFVNTIKSFWEQTLIRDFIEYKQREFQDEIFVTEDEIKNYYDALPDRAALGTLEGLRPEIQKRIADEKQMRLFEDWLRSERKKARIKIIKR